MKKWKSFPEGQHTPLCAHLLGLAMKTVTQLALGERFSDDTEVLAFRKNHDAVRNFSTNLCAVSFWPLVRSVSSDRVHFERTFPCSEYLDQNIMLEHFRGH